MKNIVVLESSLRPNSNSTALAKAFVAGATEAGHSVTELSLVGKTIAFCKGCMACHKVGHCVIEDDALAITAAIKEADVVVYATPVYYYSVCGQLKTMLDRANSLYDSDYRFTKVMLLATAAEDEPETVAGTATAIQGWVDCFPRATLTDVVFAGGVNEVGEIENHPALQDAYQLGKLLV